VGFWDMEYSEAPGIPEDIFSEDDIDISFTANIDTLIKLDKSRHTA